MPVLADVNEPIPFTFFFGDRGGDRGGDFGDFVLLRGGGGRDDNDLGGVSICVLSIICGVNDNNCSSKSLGISVGVTRPFSIGSSGLFIVTISVCFVFIVSDTLLCSKNFWSSLLPLF